MACDRRELPSACAVTDARGREARTGVQVLLRSIFAMRDQKELMRQQQHDYEKT